MIYKTCLACIFNIFHIILPYYLLKQEASQALAKKGLTFSWPLLNMKGISLAFSLTTKLSATLFLWVFIHESTNLAFNLPIASSHTTSVIFNTFWEWPHVQISEFPLPLSECTIWVIHYHWSHSQQHYNPWMNKAYLTMNFLWKAQQSLLALRNTRQHFGGTFGGHFK